MRDKLFAVVLFTIISGACLSQPYIGILPSPGFTSALEKIVLDFREDYKNIQGKLVDNSGGTDVYESLISLPGATHCQIVRYHSAKDTTATWQATVYNGDDYNAAVKAYQNTFRQIKKSRIKWIDRSVIVFKGEMQSPREDIRFTTSLLQLDHQDPRYADFEALVEILSNYDSFTVQVSLHKKVKEIPDLE